ncbi:MAG: SAM-dependent chlorinase/fluorinase [Pseudomonadota bacterium]
MIVLFTDFGLSGPYVGQLQAAILKESPSAQVVNLFADAPAHDARRSAYLLAAYVEEFPAPTVFVCVVDPGVGSDRPALVLEAGGRWLVGPDNGLLEIVARRTPAPAWWRIAWRPPRLSASFHGRDLFAPAAAWLDRGDRPFGPSAGARPPAGWAEPLPWGGGDPRDWPDDLAEVIYIDRFGNAMTGLRAPTLSPGASITLKDGREIVHARTFSDVSKGGVFWYENANGLVEIAMNCGRADVALGLTLGSPIAVRS